MKTITISAISAMRKLQLLVLTRLDLLKQLLSGESTPTVSKSY